MAIDLIDIAKGYLTPESIQKAAQNVGESPGATQKALAGIVPTLVAALANTASTNDGAQQLVRTLDTGKYDGSLLGNVTSLFTGGTATESALSNGKRILDSLLGARMGGVSDLIARFAGIRTDSASSLLALVAPLVMHVLGSQRASIGTGTAALGSLLGEQKNFLAGLVPPGLGSALGLSGLTSGVSDLGASAAGAASRVTREVTQEISGARRSGWITPVIVVGAVLLALLAWLNWPTSSVRQAAQKLSELQLPCGARISVPEGSFNFSLASWLASATDTTIPKRFVFDNLNFETGTTALTPESIPTVNSLVAVLKAYPAVSVALEGYTDNTGEPAANTKLSLDRANAVKDSLVTGGVAESRVTSAGYGQDNPIAPNDSEEGRENLPRKSRHF
jgi:outer membrane protein OmpA-like peptidoglycan-associated protein